VARESQKRKLFVFLELFYGSYLPTYTLYLCPQISRMGAIPLVARIPCSLRTVALLRSSQLEIHKCATILQAVKNQQSSENCIQ
jgi:hypothetical protein